MRFGLNKSLLYDLKFAGFLFRRSIIKLSSQLLVITLALFDALKTSSIHAELIFKTCKQLDNTA